MGSNRWMMLSSEHFSQSSKTSRALSNNIYLRTEMGQLNEVFQQEVTNIKHSVGLANTTTGKGFALVGGIAVVGAVSFATVVEVVSFPFWVVGRGIEIAEEKKRQKRLIAEDKAAKAG